MHRLLIVSADGDEYRRHILEAVPGLEVKVFADDPDSYAFARDMDVLFTWTFPRELLARATRLRWIQSTGAGIDHIVSAGPIPSNVIVTRMVNVYGRAMAEYVLGYMLAATLQVPRVVAQQKARRWEKFSPPLLRGQTAVVVGLGSIGREIAGLLRSAGLTVIGVSKFGRPVDEADTVLPVARMDEALPAADFLVCVVPLTSESRHLIDRRRLSLLPRRAWVMNIGRGAVVDEAELVAALEQGRIAGAILDVFEREPLPDQSPLWSMPNVIVTPHISGPDDVALGVERFVANYRRFAAGQPLEGVVDLAREY